MYRKTTFERGFTLVEVSIVLAVLGLLKLLVLLLPLSLKKLFSVCLLDVIDRGSTTTHIFDRVGVFMDMRRGTERPRDCDRERDRSRMLREAWSSLPRGLERPLVMLFVVAGDAASPNP